jgi:predicted CXXCH cytochrome family protein
MRRIVVVGVVFVGATFAMRTVGCAHRDDNPTPEVSSAELASWGDDHVGRDLPEFVTGDECLFCHREVVGPEWSQNRHQHTMRAEGSEMLVGGRRTTRQLRPSKDYGKVEIASLTKKGHWEADTFAERCAGCHATAVDSKTGAFSAFSLDCSVCHGDVQLDHSKAPETALLSKRIDQDPRVVTSICASCHLRGGRSRSTGRPYPNHFVAGDNLFRDLQADLSESAIASAHPLDRHILENIRDVVVNGRTETTCLSCHRVHRSSSRRHRRLPDAAICQTCHEEESKRPPKKLPPIHSKTCEY